jgi:hypothetical protein
VPQANAWSDLVLWGSGASMGQAGSCTYQGGPPAAYLPGCPGYASQEMTTQDQPTETGQWGASFGFGTGFPVADRYGVGLWNATGAEISGASRVILFVQPLPPGASTPVAQARPPPTLGAEGAWIGDPSLRFGGAVARRPAGTSLRLGAIEDTVQPPGTLRSS